MKEFLIIVVLVIVGGAGYFLYKDYHKTDTIEDLEKNREVIGEVLISENNVKRQYGQEVLWNTIDKKEPVFNQDSIRTGKDSSAAIKLNDNTIIEINENSLIVLDKTQNNFNVDFKAGNIAAKNSSDKLQISIKGSMIKGQGAEVKIKTGPDSKAKIEVTKGKATIQDRNNKSVELTENEQTSLDEKGSSGIIKMAVILKSPENKTQIVSTDPNARYAFTWQVTSPSLVRESFEISKSMRFPKDQTKTFSAHQAITAPISPGTNYWRVSWGDGKNKNYSEVREISVGHDKRLELVYPENQSQFQFDPEENNMDLQWKSLLQAKVYMVEGSRTDDFRNIVFTQSVNGKADFKTVVKNIDAGTYYWRVKAFGEKNDLLATSNIFNFSIKLKLATLPDLIKPAADYVWSDGTPVGFSWQKMNNAASYRLVISADVDQKSIIKTQAQRETTYTWPSKTQQVVYWSVTALNNKLVPVGKSEVRRLTIQKVKQVSAFILVNPRDKFEVQRAAGPTADPVLFQWKIGRPLPGPVTLFIADNEDFKNPVIRAGLKKYSEGVKLEKEGMYFWKLESRSPANKEIVDTSEVTSFILKHVNLIPAPELLTPDSKEKIETDDAQVVKFSWKPVQGAVQYHVVVENINPKTSEKKTVLDKVIKETSVASIPLNEGSYVWSVSSFDVQGQEGSTSRSREFNIVPFEAVDAPLLNNPVVK